MEIRQYELSFWLTSTLTETEVEPVFTELVKKIESLGYQIINIQNPQLKPLSYKIKKETNGYFGVIKFKGDSAKLTELEKDMRLDNKILRFIIVKSLEDTKDSNIKEINHSTTAKEQLETTSKEKSMAQAKTEADINSRVEMSLEELDKKLNEILKE